MMAGWEPKRTLPASPKGTSHTSGLVKRHKEEGLDSDDAQKPWKLFPGQQVYLCGFLRTSQLYAMSPAVSTALIPV